MLWAYTNKVSTWALKFGAGKLFLIKFGGTFRLKLDTKWLKLLPMSSLNLKLRSNEIHSIGFDCIQVCIQVSQGLAHHMQPIVEVEGKWRSKIIPTASSFYGACGPQAVRWEGFSPARFRTRRKLWAIFVACMDTAYTTAYITSAPWSVRHKIIGYTHVLLTLVDLTMHIRSPA